MNSINIYPNVYPTSINSTQKANMFHPFLEKSQRITKVSTDPKEPPTNSFTKDKIDLMG